MSASTTRYVDDTQPLTFRWPVDGASVTAVVAIDGSAAVPVVGTIASANDPNGNYFYTLSYAAADRPAGVGTAAYSMTDGVFTRFFVLHLVENEDQDDDDDPYIDVGGVDCENQNKIPARQTVVDGCPVMAKMQCHEVQMGQDARLIWQFKNPEGDPVHLGTCESQCSTASQSADDKFDAEGTPDCGVELRMREITGHDQTDRVFKIDVDVIDSASGTVRSQALPEALVRAPGIYIEEWGMFTSDGRMLFSNQCCTFVRRGLFGLSNDPAQRNLGPPTIEEIRLAFRDNAPEDNLLLESVEFDAAEIAQAVTRPLGYWNEIPPPIRPPQTTKNFPFREIWMLGIQAYLLEISAHNYRRNHLAYSAGGLSVDDKNKEQAYAAKGMEMMQRFQEMVLAKKIEINTSLFAGSIGSSYSGYFY